MPTKFCRNYIVVAVTRHGNKEVAAHGLAPKRFWTKRRASRYAERQNDVTALRGFAMLYTFYVRSAS